MCYGLIMARPKSDDPKVNLSIRVKASVVLAYQTRGKNWRDDMHRALESGLGLCAPPEPDGAAILPEAYSHRKPVPIIYGGRHIRGFDRSTGEPIYE